MALTGEKKREYDAKRYAKKKAEEPAARKIYFPMRYPEGIIAAANRIASEGQLGGKYPWKTTSDVLRAMVAKGFRAFRDETGDLHVASLLEKLEAESQLADVSRERRLAATLMAKAKIEIQAMLDIGATNEAIQLYSTMYDNVENMSKTIWTIWLERELQRAFPDLHKRHEAGTVPGVKLQRKRTIRERREGRKAYTRR